MIDNKVTFHVEQRKLLGKRAAKLKNEGKLLGNVFGLKQESIALQLDKKEVEKQLKHSDAGLVYLSIDGAQKSVPVLIDQVDRDVITGALLHLSFRRVNLTEKVVTEVEVRLVGENDVPESTVLQTLDSLEVESLPTDIPEAIELDISELTEVGQTITIQDVITKTGLAIVCDEEALESPVLVLQEFVEEVEPEASEEPVETEVIGKGKKDEDGESTEGGDSGSAQESEASDSE